MSRTTAPQPLRQSQLEVRLPPLHPKQQEVALSGARFKVVACGRQWGKTVLGAVLCVAEASRGGNVWWVAPSFPVGELGWRIIDGLCRQIPGTAFEQRPVYRITLPSGGTIQLRSADNPDSLRGATLDGVVFDEAAVAKQEAWPTLRPTLSARQGWALFISTPKGLNWFHDLYENAEHLPGWERWRFPSVTNPHLPPEDIELARSEMASLIFSEEYEAEFMSVSARVFHADWFRHYHLRSEGEARFFQLGEVTVPYASCWRFHTVDLAWSLGEYADYTVISTWAVTPTSDLILLDVIRGRFEGPDIVPQMRRACERYGGYLVVEKTAGQLGIVQEANRAGLPVRPVRADKDKVARALPATARMEQGKVWFPQRSVEWFRDIEEELLAFPSGRHDDFVDTLGYAVSQIAKKSIYEDRGLLEF